MKKIISILCFMILIFSVSYANTEDGKVPANVVSVFNQDFSFADHVSWENVSGYYKAGFNSSDKRVFVFYTPQGEFMGMASNILSTDLPSLLSEKLKNYEGYWISDLFRFDINNSTGYFVTLENGDRKITLKAEDHLGWQLIKEIRKH